MNGFLAVKRVLVVGAAALINDEGLAWAIGATIGTCLIGVEKEGDDAAVPAVAACPG